MPHYDFLFRKDKIIIMSDFITAKMPIRKLYAGADNLAVMRGLDSESVDLIYLDPPFNSKAIYKGTMGSKAQKQQFKDVWQLSDINEDELDRLRLAEIDIYNLISLLGKTHGESWDAYLTFMAVRLLEMHRLLKDTGSIYLHCDLTMSASLRLLMDLIFGQQYFRNEVIWCYSGGGLSKRYFPKKHDSILLYTKTNNYIFNVEYRFYGEHNTTGMRATSRGGTRKVEYNKKGTPINNWWVDIKPIINWHAEKTGWATQKPLALLKRIIKASSNKGNLVVDPFCGCATACVAAEQLERQWIGIDIDMETANIMRERAEGQQTILENWDNVVVDARRAALLPRRENEKEFNKNDKALKRELYDRQGRKCAAKNCLNNESQLSMDLMEMDRILSGKRGGRYILGNVQLLCPQCNRLKGAGTMKTLEKKLAKKSADELYRSKMLATIAAKQNGDDKK